MLLEGLQKGENDLGQNKLLLNSLKPLDLHVWQFIF